MHKIAMVNTRIEPKLKAEAEAILREVGLTSAEAVRLFYKQICLNKGLPFDIKIPNEDTRRTLEKSVQGIDVKRFDSVEDLFEDLDD